jgi:hypothetical protein
MKTIEDTCKENNSTNIVKKVKDFLKVNAKDIVGSSQSMKEMYDYPNFVIYASLYPRLTKKLVKKIGKVYKTARNDWAKGGNPIGSIINVCNYGLTNKTYECQDQVAFLGYEIGFSNEKAYRYAGIKSGEIEEEKKIVKKLMDEKHIFKGDRFCDRNVD